MLQNICCLNSQYFHRQLIRYFFFNIVLVLWSSLPPPFWTHPESKTVCSSKSCSNFVSCQQPSVKIWSFYILKMCSLYLLQRFCSSSLIIILAIIFAYILLMYLVNPLQRKLDSHSSIFHLHQTLTPANCFWYCHLFPLSLANSRNLSHIMTSPLWNLHWYLHMHFYEKHVLGGVMPSKLLHLQNCSYFFLLILQLRLQRKTKIWQFTSIIFSINSSIFTSLSNTIRIFSPRSCS